MNFLIVGGGSIGKRHIKNLKAIGYEHIWCLKRQLDENFEAETGAKVITNLDALQNIRIDAVFACNPTALHKEAVEMALQLNAAIFMEKPLTHAAQDLKEIEAILQKSTKPFFIGFMLRFHPLVMQLKSLLETHQLGKMYHARFEFGSFLPYWHPWEDHRISYASQKELGGGVINTITHELDLILHFFGKPDSVFCKASNFGKLDIEVEEMAEAIFEYPDKLVTLHLDYLQKDYDRRIKFLFDEGWVSWNWHENQIVLKKHKEESTTVAKLQNFDVNQLYIDELKAFIQLIEAPKAHSLDFSYAKMNTEVLFKMHASNQNQQTIKL